MKINLNIPAKIVPQEIVQFRFNPGSKLIEVIIHTEDKNITQNVDITDLWTAATAQQRTIFMALFKNVGVLAFKKYNEENGVDVVEEDVENEIF